MITYERMENAGDLRVETTWYAGGIPEAEPKIRHCGKGIRGKWSGWDSNGTVKVSWHGTCRGATCSVPGAVLPLLQKAALYVRREMKSSIL